MSYKLNDCLVVDTFTEDDDLDIEGGFIIGFVQHIVVDGLVSSSKTYALILDVENNKISECKLQNLDVRSGFVGNFE